MLRDTYIQRKKLIDLCPDQTTATFNKNFAELLGLRYDSNTNKVYFFDDGTNGLNFSFTVNTSNKSLTSSSIYFGNTVITGYTMGFNGTSVASPTDGSDSLLYYYLDETVGVKLFGIAKKNARVSLTVAITTEYNPIDSTAQNIVIMTTDVLGPSNTNNVNVFRNNDGSVYKTNNWINSTDRLCPIGLLVPILDTSANSILSNFYLSAALPIGSVYQDACVFKMGNEYYIAMSDSSGNVPKICFKLSATDFDPSVYYDNKLIPMLTNSNDGTNGSASCPLKSPLYNGTNSGTDMRAYYAFDNTTNTHLEYFGENQSGAWCRYDFTNPIHLLRMTATIGHYNPSNQYAYELQYLKNGTEDEWITLGSGIHTGAMSIVDHSISDAVVTSAVRFYSSSTKTTSSNIFLYELQAYGW